MQLITIQKGVFCALRPSLWRLLSLRIAPAIEHIEALSRLSFQTVVDVGANRGQFAVMARRLFPQAQIYSFEPLGEPAARFTEALGQDDRVRLFPCAIGPTAGPASIYVTSRDDSSSLLRPGSAQTEIFGGQTARKDEIAVCRLSDCLEAGAIQGPALLKVDVQGGELDVLQGSADLIDQFEALYIECSFIQLYEGQPLFGDISRWAEEHGFRLGGVYNQYVDPRHGPVQADFLFLKTAPPGGRPR